MKERAREREREREREMRLQHFSQQILSDRLLLAVISE